MAVKQEYIDIIVNIPGFSVVMVGTVGEDGKKILMIALERREALYKGRCGREFSARHDSSERCVRDMPYGPWKYSRLVFWQARVDCPKCGVVTEHLDWVGRRGGDSQALAAGGGLSCRGARSIKSGA